MLLLIAFLKVMAGAAIIGTTGMVLLWPIGDKPVGLFNWVSWIVVSYSLIHLLL